MLFSKHNLLTLIVIDNKLQSQKRTIPQNAANTAPLVSPELLALHSVGAAIKINADYTGNEPVVILCTNCKVCRQKFNLAGCCAICNNIHRDGILLSPLVTKDHLLPAEHHLCANPYLDSTGIVAYATAVLAAHPHPNNINEHVNQPGDNGSRLGATKSNFVSGEQSQACHILLKSSCK